MRILLTILYKYYNNNVILYNVKYSIKSENICTYQKYSEISEILKNI